MRRNERQINDREEIDRIISDCQVCRLGLSDGLEPYIVPLCFGYDGKALYFHGAPEGRKMDLLRKNGRVSFEFDVVRKIARDETACRWSMAYESVMGTGSVVFLESPADKREALAVLMAQYSDEAYSFPDPSVEAICVFKVHIDTICGKQSTG